MTSGWICFTVDPIKANFTIVYEFYVNAADTDFANNLVVTVRDGRVDHIIMREIQELILERSKSLFFPSITHLRYQTGVDKKNDDCERVTEKPMHLLKKRGMGMHKRKERLIKFVLRHRGMDPCDRVVNMSNGLRDYKTFIAIASQQKSIHCDREGCSCDWEEDLLKGSSIPRSAMIDHILDPEAFARRISEVPKKKKATKPPSVPASPSVLSKRKRNLEEGGPSVVKEATNVDGTVPPPAQEPHDDNEGTEDNLLLKRPRTSTPQPKTSNPHPNFGQNDFDHLFGEAENSVPPDNQLTGDLPVVKVELDQVKSDYLQAMQDLELDNEENATLEKDVDQLYEDLQNLQLDFLTQEEVMHFKMQKENFLSAEVDRFTNELSTITRRGLLNKLLLSKT
ncbi:hypothetical protein RND71_028470 [Anisodus tanguticus]|uniref:Uncharacterized protein n=1 Tax=Anisodus tanguticus TaxID=243964 RepID=A0AAE1RLI8_9SOLA|nr:hypothetical protein RND71_028470 [Anisodus tanguticus]